MLHCGPLLTCSTAHLLLRAESHHGLHVRDRNLRHCKAGDGIAGLLFTGKLIKCQSAETTRTAFAFPAQHGFGPTILNC